MMLYVLLALLLSTVWSLRWLPTNKFKLINNVKLFSSSPPYNYDSVEADCVNSLSQYIEKLNTDKRIAIDVLTPGLNPKLEQKAILLQEYLFSLIDALLPTLCIKFNRVLLLFPSIGDAASFQKFHRMRGAELESNVILADVSLHRVSKDDDCAIFITTKNNVGDPVIRTVQEICETHPLLTAIFLNCDLSDRVTSGMKEKRIRDEFRASIRPLYYFRNLVEISRPSMNAYELGAIRYTPESGWEIYAINQADIIAMGSLNRYMKQGSFQRSASTIETNSGYTEERIYKNEDTIHAKALPPPRLILVKRYEGNSIPSRDEIDVAVTNGLARIEREQVASQKSNTAHSTSSSNSMDNKNDGIRLITVKDSRRFLYDLVSGKRPSHTGENVLTACKLMYTNLLTNTATSSKVALVSAVPVNTFSVLDEQPINMNEVVQMDIAASMTSSMLEKQRSKAIVGEWEKVSECIQLHVDSVSTFLKSKDIIKNTEMIPLTSRIVMKIYDNGKIDMNKYMRMWPLLSWLLSSSHGVYKDISHSSSTDHQNRDPIVSTSIHMEYANKDSNAKESNMDWLFVMKLSADEESTGSGGSSSSSSSSSTTSPSSMGNEITIACTHELEKQTSGLTQTETWLHKYSVWKKLS